VTGLAGDSNLSMMNVKRGGRAREASLGVAVSATLILRVLNWQSFAGDRACEIAFLAMVLHVV
jgi:hypothetical protein